MNARDLFKRLKYINTTICFMEEEIQKNIELSKRISSGALNEHFQKHSFKGNNTSFINAVHTVIDLNDEINNYIQELSSIKKNIYHILKKLEPQDQSIIQMKFISNLRAEDIAKNLSISVRELYRLQKRAIDNFEEKWKEFYKK